MTEDMDEIDERWWDLFKGNKERKRSKETKSKRKKAKELPVEKPAKKISEKKVDDEKIIGGESDKVLDKFESGVKKLDRAKKELKESIFQIIPALEEEKRRLKDESEIRFKKIEEIDEQINAIKMWIKKHKDLLKNEELEIQF